MIKKKTTLVWKIFEDEGFWKYAFGNKGSSIVYSGRIPSKELAKKALNDEIDQAKDQYGQEWDVDVEEIKE